MYTMISQLKSVMPIVALSLVSLFFLYPPPLATCQESSTNSTPVLTIESEQITKSPEEQDRNHERLSIVAPKTIRPNGDYHVIVSLARSQVPATVDLSIIGGRDSSQENTNAKSVIAQAGETQTVKFNIGDWPVSEYVLNVSAQAIDRSWNFSQEASLVYQPKRFSILIQTDKAIYKPGDEVKIRAIFLDPQMQPIHLVESINVSVSDTKRNLVKQWTNMSNKRGLISLTMPLSDDPMLGSDWTVRVNARGQVASKKFQVAEYILPTFDVHIDLPSFATYNESNIVASVRATYTHGKPVDGHVTLTVQPRIRYYRLQTRPLDANQFRGDLTAESGKIDFQVDLVRDLWLQTDQFEREIEFFALVEEKLTGRKYNKTAFLSIYDKPIKINLISSEQAFKPGLPHLFKFKVSYQNDRPVEDDGPEMVVRLVADNQQLLNITKLRPVAGQAQFWLDIPRKMRNLHDSDANSEERIEGDTFEPNYIDVQVMYRGQVHHVESILGQKTKSKHHMSVSLASESSEISPGANRRSRIGRPPRSVVSLDDGELRIRVRATEVMTQVTCQGLARGDIVWVVNREPRNETQFEFNVKLDQRMTPEARILCFYVRDEDRELIADAISVPIKGLFRNILKLSLDSKEARPGQEIEIKALTKPDSLVALLAIDQSVLLLKTGNDISQSDLEHEARSYGGSNSEFRPFWGSATSSSRIFEQSDVVILTNNRVFNGWDFSSAELVPRFAMSAMAFSGSSSVRMPNSPERIEISEDSPVDLSRPVANKSFKHGSGEQIVIRSLFPETWLWVNGTSREDGIAHFFAKVPDTITSWQLTGFSLNDEYGFGLTQSSTNLRVFKPFFIKLNLPHSMIRGEVLNLQCIVFNYGSETSQVRVTLENLASEFDFVEATNELDDDPVTNLINISPNQNTMVRELSLKPEQTGSVSFLIRPKKLGHIDLRVFARSSSGYGDGILKKLLVKPEGQIQYMNKAILLNLADSEQSQNVSIEFPPNAVQGSQKVFVSVIGDVMGAGLANIDDLLRMPYGCGEQNLINLVPNIVILDYLTSSRRLLQAQKQRATRNIETGYQRQLNYKRRDGSFSAFGDADKNGSVWLTAYVLKTFKQARHLTSVDPMVLHNAANFIGQFSQSDGSIRELGMIHDKRLQSASASSSNIYLTAYSMVALLQPTLISENASNSSKNIETETVAPNKRPIDEVIEYGLNFLESQLEAGKTLTTYELSIITYALELASRPSAQTAYQRLWSEAHSDTSGTWWSNEQSNSIERQNESEKLISEPGSTLSPNITARIQPPLKPVPLNTKHSAHLFLPESLNIEMTALALLSTVHRGELDKALPIVKWLVGQQNSNGGFASTQDTVLAIEALASFASANARLTDSKPTKINIDLTYARQRVNNTSKNFRQNNIEQLYITNANELVAQKISLPENTHWVQVDANGHGSGVVQISWQYNLLVSAEQPAFYLNPIIDKTSTINYLQLSICTHYKAGEQSNMALVDVELPSGYVADVESLQGLRRTRQIKRIDTSEADTRVFVYLDRVTRNELCFTVPAHRNAKVSNNKPVPVTIYDYYNRHEAARIFYEPELATTCDICDSDSCSKECRSNSRKSDRTFLSLHEQRRLNNMRARLSNSSSHLEPSLIYLMVFLSFFFLM